MDDKVKTGVKQESGFEVHCTRHFTSWLAEQQVSLAFTTYQAGKLFFLGLQENGQLSIFERSFTRCMGLYATPDAQTLYMSTLYQIWRFERVTDAGITRTGYDSLYIPQSSSVTGDMDIHDMAIDADGRLIFVNTLFSCLAAMSERHSFIPLWTPPFITKLAAEDRCHLNGLAMKDGKPKYVTSVSQSDANNGWRDKRIDGGVVIDVDNNDIIAEGLSMPHSPRLYQDKLWLLNSGTGEFGFVNTHTGTFEPAAFCPGYLRGMAFMGDYAVVGLSQPRDNKSFTDLPLQERLKTKNTEPRCGLQIIDLKSGDVVHGVTIKGVVSELYDVVVLPKVKRPLALGFKTNEIQQVVSIGE